MIFEQKTTIMTLKTIGSFILFALFTISQIQSQEKFTLTIEIDGIKKQKGAVLVMLCNSEASFLEKGEGFTAKVSGEKVIATYSVPKGEYAFSFFHDKNSNGKFDTNFIGIPTEPYGFSNNAKGFMGPPSYEKAKFTVTKDTKVSVSF